MRWIKHQKDLPSIVDKPWLLRSDFKACGKAIEIGTLVRHHYHHVQTNTFKLVNGLFNNVLHVITWASSDY